MHGAEKEESDDSEKEEAGPPRKRQKSEDDIDNSFGTKLSYALRDVEDVDKHAETQQPDQQASAKATWKNILRMPDVSLKPKPVALSSAKDGKKRLGVSFFL